MEIENWIVSQIKIEMLVSLYQPLRMEPPMANSIEWRMIGCKLEADDSSYLFF